MNKAFVREPDRTAEYCPHCGSAGESVGSETVMWQLPDSAGNSTGLSDPANFCPAPRCPVAYFDAFEQVILAADLARTVYPKDPDAPICPCFGLTCEDIEQDVREGVVTRTRQALEQAKSQGTHCHQQAANGRSCVPYIQKLYMQRQAEWNSER